MKIFFTTLLFAAGLSVYGQQTITLTEDLVLTETLVLEEDVTYEGNGFSIICNGCSPAIYVKNGSRVHFQDVRFKKGYESWMRVQGGNNGNVTWDGPGMVGFIRSNDEE